MDDFDVIFEWLKNNCSALYDLWAVASLLGDRKNIIQPRAAANMYNVDFERYADGGKKYSFNPTEPYFFDVDIICYRTHYADENEENLDTLKSVQAVCDWLIEQQNSGNVPIFTTYPCYQLECLTTKPFIQDKYIDDGNNSIILVDYVVTVRFYTVNPARKRVVLQ